MKNTLIYLLLFSCCSCAVRKLQRPTTAVDLKTGATIKDNSIQLPKGKICYVYTPRYDSWLFGRSVFKNRQSSSFYSGSTSPHNSMYHGAASKSSEVDTAVHNEWVVQMALQEALTNAPLGSRYQYVSQDEFTDADGVINTAIVGEKFNPDIIISLKSLSLKMKGNTHSGMTDIESKPGIVNYCCYSYTTGVSSYYGNILMDYTAVWEVRNIKEHTMRDIRQEGRYVSMYHNDYSINEEVMACAEKIGKEFSGLFKNSYRHSL